MTPGLGWIATFNSIAEEPTNTDDMMNSCNFLEKTPGADILRDMISFAAGRLEVGALTGATHDEKNPLRLVMM